MRDAENLLDQVIGFCGNQVQDQDVRYVLGIPDQQLLWDFLTVLSRHQSSQIFSLMDRLVNQGYNLRFFCMELMERIRNMIVLHVAAQPEPYLSLFDYSRPELARYAKQMSVSELQQMYWILAQVEQEMKFSPNPRYVLEFALVRMANVQTLEPLDSIQAQLQQIQAEIKPAASKISAVVKHTPIKSEEGPTSLLSDEELQQLWQEVLAQLKETRPPLAARVKQAVPVHLTHNEFLLGFHPDAEFSRQALDDAKNRDILAAVLKEYLGRSVRVATTTTQAAVSYDTIRKIHAETVASIPRPEVRAQEVKSGSSSEQRSRKNNDGWQKRNATPRYKPPVQVTVQDIVRLFDGEIEK